MSQQNVAGSRLRDPSTLWPTFRNMVVVLICLEILVALTVLYEIQAGAIDYENMSPLTMVWGLLTLVAGIAYTVFYIVCIVLFCKLTYRMMRNLHELQSPEAQTSPSWAVGWYFIPLANLVMPLLAFLQIRRGTFALAGREPHGPVGWWWAAWLIGNILSNIQFQLQMRSGGMDAYGPHDMGMYSSGLVLGVVASLFGLAASALVLATFEPVVRAQSEVLRAHSFQ